VAAFEAQGHVVILVVGEGERIALSRDGPLMRWDCMNGAPAVWVGFYVWATRPTLRIEIWGHPDLLCVRPGPPAPLHS
jgi:hypothetical protein